MKRQEIKVVLQKWPQSWFHSCGFSYMTRQHHRKVPEHSVNKGPFAKAPTPKRKSRHPLSVYKADIKETAQWHSVIQLKETNFGVWFSAVKGIRVISSHSPPLCTDYRDQNREDLESRHILRNRPHYQHLIISLSSQLIITRGHVPHGPALNLQRGRGEPIWQITMLWYQKKKETRHYFAPATILDHISELLLVGGEEPC